jgi:hypothetical protein
MIAIGEEHEDVQVYDIIVVKDIARDISSSLCHHKNSNKLWNCFEYNES